MGWRSCSWLACPGRPKGRGNQVAQLHHGTQAPLGGRVLRQAQDRTDLGEVQAVEIAQGQDLAVDGVEPLQRRPHNLARSARDRAVAGPVWESTRCSARGAADPSGQATSRSTSRSGPKRDADQLDEPVEHLAIDPGIEVRRFRVQFLPARPARRYAS